MVTAHDWLRSPWTPMRPSFHPWLFGYRHFPAGVQGFWRQQNSRPAEHWDRLGLWQKRQVRQPQWYVLHILKYLPSQAPADRIWMSLNSAQKAFRRPRTLHRDVNFLDLLCIDSWMPQWTQPPTFRICFALIHRYPGITTSWYARRVLISQCVHLHGPWNCSRVWKKFSFINK